MKSGYGKFRCGNCRWFSEPRQWGSLEQNCQEAFGVTSGSAPCAAKKLCYGEFSPLDIGERVSTIEKIINSMPADDLIMVRILVDRREKDLLQEGISVFRIGDRVVFTLDGEDVQGDVVGLTQKYVSVEDGEGKQRKLLPGSLRFV